MLDEFLKTDNTVKVALYKIGRVLGFFSENSFKQYEYLLNDESDNDVRKLLSSILASLTHCGAIVSTDENRVKWNENFKIDSYLEMMQQKKASRARQAQDRAAIKNILRKFATE